MYQLKLYVPSLNAVVIILLYCIAYFSSAEWEKCSRDISELQWHFEEKNNQLQDAVNQLTKIDVANAKVLENIAYMKKYSPLLGEKLSYEGDAMVQVKKIYTQVNRSNTLFYFPHAQ